MMKPIGGSHTPAAVAVRSWGKPGRAQEQLAIELEVTSDAGKVRKVDTCLFKGTCHHQIAFLFLNL